MGGSSQAQCHFCWRPILIVVFIQPSYGVHGVCARMCVNVRVYTCLLLCVWSDDKVTCPILKEKIPVYHNSLRIPEREVAVTSNMMFLEMLLDVLLVKAFTVGEYSSEHLQRWQILYFL